ncbi:hypothetical protein PMG11_06289 [Penicillium brasilianum]|uniref:TAM domain methyltransferase n=1 Tax=Penicillium brasilianum TaxID=104259 RepID=A0A0F7TP15_PENBI|nr:hypothetical protein PMG11_06289 [Penicillium brasilianum]
MHPALFRFCCCYPTIGTGKLRFGEPKTGIGTDMAPATSSHPDDPIVTSTTREDGDHECKAIESANFQSSSNFESRIVMNGPEWKETPAPSSPLLFQPIVESENEEPIQATEIDTRSSCIDGMGTPTQLPEPFNVDRTVQVQASTSQSPSRSAQTVADPGDDPAGDRAEYILAIPPQLTPIPEAVEKDISGERSPQSNSDFPPPRSAEEEFLTLRAVTSTAATGSVGLSPKSSTLTSTFIFDDQSELVMMQPENFPNPSSWVPLDPDHEEMVDISSTEDSANDAGDSVFDEDGYHSDTSSYTASLLSDVKDYAYENGRRYHSYREGNYVLPNDEQEQDRQDLLHHVRNLVLNGALFRTPLEPSIQRVLDIGTGTGIWAIDFADSFPSAEVIGTDLSPIQPSWVPPNLRFIVDDAEEPWLLSANRPFDFIHARDLGGAIADWPRLLRQAYKHLKPGGWIELQEFEVMLKSDDDTLKLAPTLCEYLRLLHEASEAFQRPMNIAEGHRARLAETGFEKVRDEVYKVPSSSWAGDPVQKQIGRYNLCSLLMAVESYSLALFTRVLGWPNNDTQVFLAGVRKDLKNPQVHSYCNLHVVYGRKPQFEAGIGFSD